MAESGKVIPLRGKSKTLPDWFPLPCYRQKLKPEQWVAHLTFRMAVRSTFRNTGDAVKGREIFDSLIVKSDYSVEDGKKLVNPNPRWPVTSLNVFEAFYLAGQWQAGEHADIRELAQLAATDPARGIGMVFERQQHGNNNRDIPDALRIAPDETAGTQQAEIMGWRVPVSIDITQDDDSLKMAFEVWLAGVRGQQGAAPPKSVDKKELQRWQAFGLLPAFDLNLWGEITGQRLTDAMIGHTLWPDQDPDAGFVDTTERYRKTTKPLLDKVFNWAFTERMINDLGLVHSLKKIHADAVARGEAKPLPEDD